MVIIGTRSMRSERLPAPGIPRGMGEKDNTGMLLLLLK